MKKIIMLLVPIIIIGFMIGWISNSVNVLAVAPTCSDLNKIAICHKAGGSGNYTSNCVDKSGLNGHDDHDNDIIPPYQKSGPDYPGKNWNTTGQGIYNNNCVIPPVATNTPTRTPTPRATNTPIPTIEPTKEPEPTSTPIIEPTVTIEPTDNPIEPTKEPDNYKTPEITDHNSAGSYEAPKCNVELPKVASNPQYVRIGDTVRIRWQHNGDNLSKWSLNYGYDRDNMFMGIPFIQREAREIDINGLQKKTTWFALCSWNTDQCENCIVFDP